MHETIQHVPAFIHALEPTINKYGYLAVGGLVMLEDFGVPSPGETVLIASAFFAGLGQLNIFLVVVVGFLGAVLGDNIGFAVGNYGGHPLVERFGKYIFLSPSRIKKAEQFFNKYGGRVVVVARFIEGLRQVNGIIAGLSEMRWLSFLFFNAIGAAAWVSVWTAIGYYGGDHINTFLKYQIYFSLVVVIFIIGFISYKIIKRRSKKRSLIT